MPTSLAFGDAHGDGGSATHIRRHEGFVANIALLLLAAFVAVGRFLGY
jgi:hypothetical protein